MSPAVLAAVEAAVCRHAGHAPARAQVTFLGVEPIEILRFRPAPDRLLLVSLGMSRHPMIAASEMTPPPDAPRAELAVQVRDPDAAFPELWRALAVLAAAPAVESVVYEPGATVDLGSALAAGSRWTGVIVAEPWLAAITTPAGPVDVFSVVPATATELAWCRVHGNPALRDRWAAQAIDLLDPTRPAAVLD